MPQTISPKPAAASQNFGLNGGPTFKKGFWSWLNSNFAYLDKNTQLNLVLKKSYFLAQAIKWPANARSNGPLVKTLSMGARNLAHLSPNHGLSLYTMRSGAIMAP
jgi:hypothetical protein